MVLAFGWNVYAEGQTIDWRLASQNTAFVYLGADKAFPAAAKDARDIGLLVGGYYSLESSLDPAGQAELFLSRIGPVKVGHLPPAVWIYRAEQLAAAKAFVETLEAKTGRRTLIGGTPKSLDKAGALFGRTNPLWLSYTPSKWYNQTPKGWDKISVSQPEPRGQVKGVSGTVGLNLADPSFISVGKGEKLALGMGALFLAGVALYYYTQDKAP